MRRSFCKCRRAAWNCLAGCMRPAGRSLPTPGLWQSNFWRYHRNRKTFWQASNYRWQKRLFWNC